METPVGAVFVANVGTAYEFDAQIDDSSGNKVLRTTFNFNPNSSKYIRKVFNTNPTLANDAITPAASLKTYWLRRNFRNSFKKYCF